MKERLTGLLAGVMTLLLIASWVKATDLPIPRIGVCKHMYPSGKIKCKVEKVNLPPLGHP